MVEPELHGPGPGHRGLLIWRLLDGTRSLSSAAVGGGGSTPSWIVNIGVDRHYGRTDLDRHVAEIAAEHRLVGPGVGLLTAADVDRFGRGRCDGVVAHATVGISKPVWAADRGGGWNSSGSRSGADVCEPIDDDHPGTINTVVQLPVALASGAAVNAVITATEAKTQAMIEADIPGTGTASDAVVVSWPERGDSATFAGPRSRWGARVALATHEAVAAGLAACE